MFVSVAVLFCSQGTHWYRRKMQTRYKESSEPSALRRDGKISWTGLDPWRSFALSLLLSSIRMHISWVPTLCQILCKVLRERKIKHTRIQYNAVLPRKAQLMWFQRMSNHFPLKTLAGRRWCLKLALIGNWGWEGQILSMKWENPLPGASWAWEDALLTDSLFTDTMLMTAGCLEEPQNGSNHKESCGVSKKYIKNTIAQKHTR